MEKRRKGEKGFRGNGEELRGTGEKQWEWARRIYSRMLEVVTGTA